MTAPDPDRAERAWIAAEAAVSARLAGHEDDPWLADLTAKWVDGSLTLAQVRAAVDAEYDLRVSPLADQEER